jgi:SPP1 gp7 family putative phage head morphogenesis protein
MINSSLTAWLKYRNHAKTSDFAQMKLTPEILMGAFNLAPKDAIEYFKQKGFRITWDWREMEGEAHAKAFTVAKAMRIDILEDIREMVQKAIDKGITFESFQKELEPKLESRGWWGWKKPQDVPTDGEPMPEGDKAVELGTPHRLETIFRTNIQSSYMVGRYKAMKSVAKSRPYWQYLAVLDNMTRDEHAAMHGRVFRHDDPIWDEWYPPNGFNCRCRVISRDADDIEKKGLDVEESDDGVILDSEGLPVRPDEKWDYNPGREGIEQLEKITETKQAQLEKNLGTKIPDENDRPPEASPETQKASPIEDAAPEPDQIEISRPDETDDETRDDEIDDEVIELKGERYSDAYREKLIDIWRRLSANGLDVEEHALNRIAGRINSGRISSIEDIIETIKYGTAGFDEEGHRTRTSETMTVHLGYSGSIITITPRKRGKSRK